ncbi:hypothetical protein EVAR_84842_1 [Eumeta japonica]|uniref:Uncharacterized protein n=1 Tax=Eumeta variegata TaxID=151549 RepID=A0A4C1U874_EUMVA|nr:hypothetical protein EVAR_84842_1 [Eumeta japonica]
MGGTALVWCLVAGAKRNRLKIKSYSENKTDQSPKRNDGIPSLNDTDTRDAKIEQNLQRQRTRIKRMQALCFELVPATLDQLNLNSLEKAKTEANV